MDNITLQRINLMHPKARPAALAAYAEMVKALTGKAIVRFAYTIRTFAEQTALYAQGRTKLYDAKGNRLGIVTNAPAGKSYHNYGLAFDIALLVDSDGNGSYDKASWEHTVDFDKDGKADWMECVAIAKKHGFAWGGDFKSLVDRPHFEMTFGKTTKQLLALHNAGKLDCNGFVSL